MDEAVDLVGARRRRLRIAAVLAIIAAAIAIVLLVWQRGRARKDAARGVRAMAIELDRCIVGADGIPDDEIYDRFVVRELDGHGVPLRMCDDAARAKAQDLDLDELPDAAASLARTIDRPDFSDLEEPARAACSRVADLRRAVAAFDGRPQPAVRCELRPSNAHVLETEHTIERRIVGDFLYTESTDAGAVTVRRYRPDGGVDAELGLDSTVRYAIDGDDLVFVTPAHLSRWRRGRTDGPALSSDFGAVRAWRDTPTGAVGVFFDHESDGFRVQAFDDALRPVGAPRVIAAPHDADVAIGPGGEVVAQDDRFACTTARTIWSVISTRVQSAPIGQPLAGDGTLTPADGVFGFDCDDAHLYIVTQDAYVTCDRARCAVGHALPHLERVGVRAHDGGAEVLAVVELGPRRVLVDLRDPRGDGHVTITPLEAPIDVEYPLSFGGRWFVMLGP